MAGAQKLIEFQNTFPFTTARIFSDNVFNSPVYYSPVSKTVHNNIGFDWAFEVYHNEAIIRKRSFTLGYMKGLHQELENICLSHFVDKVSLRQADRFYWFGPMKFGKGWNPGSNISLASNIDELQARCLITDDDTIQLVVGIGIPEEHFSWKEILEKRKAELLRSSDQDFGLIVGEIATTDSEDRPDSDVARVLDYKIKTTDGAWIWCHKVALKKNERFLNLMTNQNFRESAENIVQCDYDRDTMMEVLHFIYTDRVSEEFHNRHVEEVCRGAHYYELEGLKLACEGRLIEGLGVGNARRMLKLADLYALEVLYEMSLNVVSENLSGLLASVRSGELSEELCEKILENSDKRARVIKLPEPST